MSSSRRSSRLMRFTQPSSSDYVFYDSGSDLNISADEDMQTSNDDDYDEKMDFQGNNDDSELDMEIPYGEETTLTLNAAETNDLENDDNLEMDEAAVEIMDLDYKLLNDDNTKQAINDLLIGLKALDLNGEPDLANDTETDDPKKLKAKSFNQTLINLMSNVGQAQLNKCHDAYNELSTALPDQEAYELPNFLYLLIRLPNKGFSLADFVKNVIYIGIGSYTRSYDHIILTTYYEKLLALVKQHNCEDQKHKKLLSVPSQDLFILRFHCKSHVEASCLEFGLIDAFGLKNLHGNKVRGSATSIPLDFSFQKTVDASCFLFHSLFKSLSENYSLIKENRSVIKVGKFLFESIVPSQLISRFSLPKYGDAAWTKCLLEHAKKSSEVKDQMNKHYSLLCVSQFKFRKSSTPESRQQYFREVFYRNVENVYLNVFDSAPKPYTDLTESEMFKLRAYVQLLAKNYVKRMTLDDPDYLARKRRVKNAANRIWSKTPLGKISSKRKKATYRKTESGKLVEAAYKKKHSKTVIGRKGNARRNKKYRDSTQGQAKIKAHEQTDSRKISRAKSRGHLKKKVVVNVESRTGRKCRSCEKKFSKGCTTISYWGSNFHVGCLTNYDSFRFNSQKFEDWSSVHLLKAKEKALILSKLIVNEYK